jgi:hypothetical protein
MMRLAALLMLGLLTACAARQGAQVAEPETLAADGMCRIGPKQGPVVVADRGIGGTGAPRVADRGIGGTGIVGVITGFGSVCVNGLEVRYDRSASVERDGAPIQAAALRAGQLVVIRAEGPLGDPYTTMISVRREVAGRIEAIDLAAGTVTIAGQAVSVPSETWGADNLHLGDWVAVSGLRRVDGTIVASRFDSAEANAFTVRGQVVRNGATVRIGKLAVGGTAAGRLKSGQFVTVSGRYRAGQPQVSAVALDPLFPNPAGYFGSSVRTVVLQAFVRVGDGAVWLNGMKVPLGPHVRGLAGPARLAVVSLERRPDGSYTAVRLRYTNYRGTLLKTGSAAGAGWGSPPPPPRLPPMPDQPPAQQDGEENAIPISAQPFPAALDAVADAANPEPPPAPTPTMEAAPQPDMPGKSGATSTEGVPVGLNGQSDVATRLSRLTTKPRLAAERAILVDAPTLSPALSPTLSPAMAGGSMPSSAVWRPRRSGAIDASSNGDAEIGGGQPSGE